MNLPNPGLTSAILATAFVSAITPAFIDRDPRVEILLNDAPTLSVEVAQHLSRDDDRSLEAFFRTSGYQLGSVTSQSLLESLSRSIVEGDRARTLRLARPTRRWCALLDRLHGARVDSWTLDYLLSHDRREVIARDSLFQRWVLLRDDSRDSLRSRVAGTEQLLRAFDQLDDERSVLKLLDPLSRWEHLLGRSELAWQRSREELRLARKLGDVFMEAEVLGYMGWLRADPDSTPVYYEQAMEVAQRARIPFQEARIAHFFMAHYLGLGRHAMMADYRNLGCEYAKEIGVPVQELRFVTQALQNFTRYECWNLVDQELPYAQLLLGDVPPALVLQRERWAAEIGMLQARLLLRQGRSADASRVASQALETASRSGSPVVHLTLLGVWGEALVEAGRAEEALLCLDRALLMSRPLHVVDRWHMRAVHIRALLATDRLTSAQAGLDSLKREVAAVGRTHRADFEVALLEWKLALVRRDLPRVPLIRDRAWKSFCAMLDERDQSSEAYVALNDGRELRDLAHASLSGARLEAYSLDLAWRLLYRGTPVARGGLASPGDDWNAFVEKGGQSAAALARWARRTGGVHVLFLVEDGALERWTRTRGGLEHVTIDAPLDSLEQLVRRVRHGLSAEPADPDQPLDVRLRDDLLRLSHALLPLDGLRALAGPRPTPLLFTTEGFLDGFPFQALSLDPERYVPLLTAYDVAALRFPSPGSLKPRRDEGLVVADPELPVELRRRFPELGDLQDVSVEASRVAGLLPASVVLTGAAATKNAVLSRWERASFLHFASHLVRDPEDPYLTFIPLASGGSMVPHAPRLEIADVRRADLSGCRLVVLSSCASGSPIALSPSYAAPSLADAFADAGASTVVHTYWRVRDEWARRFTTEFMDACVRQDVPAVVALSQTSRRAMNGPRGIRHPFTWAGYGILLGELPPLHPTERGPLVSAPLSLAASPTRAAPGSRAATAAHP